MPSLTSSISDPVRENRLGATVLGEGRCRFLVWAPYADSVHVHVVSPKETLLPLKKGEKGYFEVIADDIPPGSRYYYRLDGQKDIPDPASRFQPLGVHGPSQVIDSRFAWEDEAWPGRPLESYLIYELHVGTFTKEGTFEAIIPFLPQLKELGVTAIELMPIGAFPGSRNWGYDGTFPFSVHASYGGPEGFRRLVNACHQNGLSVVLDVVYNHVGPEGNYLGEYGPYFTDQYKTPWGRAMNFDGEDNGEARRFFIESALMWIHEYHVDAFRLDAVHAICDFSATPFLVEVGENIHRQSGLLNRPIYVMPESNLNDHRFVRPRIMGGFGLDAQWSDDLHHALHAVLTGEKAGVYQDFGELHHLEKALKEGFVYAGQFSQFRQRKHGNSPREMGGSQFVVCAQNHDQVGNRMKGERLAQLVSYEELKLAAGIILLSPYIPLLFMGEEYGEKAPFQFFTSHSAADIIEGTRKGRREEFRSHGWTGDPPDPQDKATFERSRLHHQQRRLSPYRELFNFYKTLIAVRKTRPALRNLSKEQMDVSSDAGSGSLWFRRWKDSDDVMVVCQFSKDRNKITVPLSAGRWKKTMASADRVWKGPGCPVPECLDSDGKCDLLLQPASFVVLEKMEEK